MEMEYSKKDMTKSPEVKSSLPKGWHMTQVRSMVWLYDPEGMRTKHVNEKDAIKFANK